MTPPAADCVAGRRGERGITLVEMMVSLAITTFVVLVINQLFNSVVSTVARGTQAGELLQKSRTFDEQIAFETELQINSDASVPANWQSRMVGPAGRDGNGPEPGGFLAIVQRNVTAPLTVEDGIRGVTRTIRSDQLMFIYDQVSPLNAPETKRLPTMAPASSIVFTGDQRDSMYADYVRMWYGHVLQVRENQDPTGLDMTNVNDYRDIDLGATDAGNPNVLAQDWVLGRHALFLTDAAPVDVPGGDPWAIPYAPYVDTSILRISAFAGIGSSIPNPPPNSPRLANGIVDVADMTLDELINGPPPGTDPSALNNINILGYQGQVLTSMFTLTPLLSSAQPVGFTGEMRAWDNSPTHTYFMGGVSDFIVEFAGDLAINHFTGPISPTQAGQDGELDRDGQGRIKWYTALNPNNPGLAGYNNEKPVTYQAPAPNLYPPNAQTAATAMARADSAFVWQHDTSNGFVSWPWMIRIRYRLHDRRGDFAGREVTISPGNTELEAGQWYETIIPVNYQGL